VIPFGKRPGKCTVLEKNGLELCNVIPLAGAPLRVAQVPAVVRTGGAHFIFQLSEKGIYL
jgi:hypothetical protein